MFTITYFFGPKVTVTESQNGVISLWFPLSFHLVAILPQTIAVIAMFYFGAEVGLIRLWKDITDLVKGVLGEQVGSILLGVIAIVNIVIAVAGASVAFIDRYSKARKFGIPHGMMMTEVREYADILMNLIVLVVIGVSAPYLNLLYSRDVFTVSILAFAITLWYGIYFIWVQFPFRWAENHKTVVMISLLPISFAATLSYGLLRLRLEEGMTEMPLWALIPLLAPFITSPICFSCVFHSRFLEGNITILSYSDGRLHVLVAKHNTETWVAVPCQEKDGKYYFNDGKFCLIKIEGQHTLHSVRSADVLSSGSNSGVNSKAKQKRRLLYKPNQNQKSGRR